MKKYLFSILCLFIVLHICKSQGTYIPPKVPEKVCKNLDAAVLASDGGQTESSIEQIKELIEKYPTWTNPRHSLSKIYYTSGRKNEAIETLEASIAIDTASQLQQLYTLARIYEETGQFDKALSTYKLLINHPVVSENLMEKAKSSYGKIEKKMATFKSDYSITLKPLPDEINSNDQEALGRWTVDGQSVIFTRKIGNEEDLYSAHLLEDNSVSRIEEFAFESPYTEGAHTISPDGKYLIFTSCMRPDGLGSCDLYLSVLEKGKWTEPENMGPGFNSSSWDSQPAFGLDGRSIYFASTRPGGSGGSDIYMTYEMSLGKWSKPINLGNDINTVNNESSPFIHFDGRTMYFMRDGEGGLGGYDLYFARQSIDNKWRSAVNMGSPINSGSDEGALALHPDGKRAMITRFNDAGKEDLFEFVLPEAFQSTPVQALYVNVIDKESRLPVHARLEIFDINHGDTIRTSQWADDKGDITVTLDRNKSYGMIATAEDYIMHSSNLAEDSATIRRINIEMVALSSAVDKPIALNNIFFETGSAKLLPSSNAELNKLVWTLRNNAQMHIEIRGHTDDVGMDDYNQVLSEERAKAVYQYLIDRGIDASRLSFKGFGETKPVAPNDSEDGKRQNRRTEFVISRT